MIFRICFTFVLASFSFSPTALLAGEYPPAYPWRGVSIDLSTVEKFTPDELRMLKKILPRLNFVQFRLNPKRSAQKERLTIEQVMSQTLDRTDLLLDECIKLNIVGLISFEGFPLDLEQKYNHVSPQFWGNKVNLNEVVHTAATLAKRFSTRGNELAAYQFISEPVVIIKGKAKVPDQWRVLLPRIIKAIRNVDPQRWIVVSPGPWGGPSGYQRFEPLGKRIVYGAHMYIPHSFTHQGVKGWEKKHSSYPDNNNGQNLDKNSLMLTLQPLREFQLKYDLPIYLGEYSAIRWAVGGENYIKDLVSIFNAYNWGWAYFSLNGWHGWNPDYSDKDYLNWREDWRNQYIGKESARWQTLRNILAD